MTTARRSSEIPRTCGQPGCTHNHDGGDEPIYLHGRCHLDAPTFTKLIGDVAIVECAECRREIVRLDLVP